MCISQTYESPAVLAGALARLVDGHGWLALSAALDWAADVNAAYATQDRGVATFATWLHAISAGRQAERLAGMGIDVSSCLYRVTRALEVHA